MNQKGLGVLRPKKLTRLVVGALTSTLLTLGLSTAALSPAEAVQTKSLATTAMATDTYEKRVIRQVNKRRANHGLRRVRGVACADRTAEAWSLYLAVNNEFYHQSMTRVLNRCNARYAGETLGRGSMAPRKLVRMWMNSPGHRAILLSRKARRIGVGATPDASGRWVVAANFVRL